jgi:hypothetical protein
MAHSVIRPDKRCALARVRGADYGAARHIFIAGIPAVDAACAVGRMATLKEHSGGARAHKRLLVEMRQQLVDAI